MMAWIYGFFMAWGMFLAIPCPFRRWNEDARGNMMVCLPLIGLLPGGLWALAAWLLEMVAAPAPVRALVLAVMPWLCTGLIHLDGYMDVCDAVLSRRDLETRQKILKDSHCGAFAVICVVLLVLTQWSLFLSVEQIPLLPLAMVPVAVRACAALAILTLRPMGNSQYAAMDRQNNRAKLAVLSIMLLAAVLIPLVFCGRAGFAPLAAAAGYWLAVWRGVQQLGGMSGDISGFALTLGELAGIAVLTLVR